MAVNVAIFFIGDFKTEQFGELVEFVLSDESRFDEPLIASALGRGSRVHRIYTISSGSLDLYVKQMKQGWLLASTGNQPRSLEQRQRVVRRIVESNGLKWQVCNSQSHSAFARISELEGERFVTAGGYQINEVPLFCTAGPAVEFAGVYEFGWPLTLFSTSVDHSMNPTQNYWQKSPDKIYKKAAVFPLQPKYASWLTLLIISVIAIQVIVSIYAAAQMRWRQARYKCIHCGYDCSGATTALCSECGSEHRIAASNKSVVV
ncbi:MAG: hypothetical protein ACTS3F_02555 [Phycisphaerales bacterium]